MNCIQCNTPMIHLGDSNWDREQKMYTTSKYRCDKCCISASSDHGIMTYIDDKTGIVIRSGK